MQKKDEHWKELLSAIQDEEWDDAIKSIDGLILQEPSDPGHFEKLGDFHTNGGNTAAAVAAFRKALLLYKKTSETTKAIVVCNRILALDPSSEDVASDLEALLLQHENSSAPVRLDTLRAAPGDSGPAGAAAKLRALVTSGTASELLKVLAGDEAPGVFDALKPIFVKPGQTIIREGETGDSIFVIVSGWVEISSMIQGRRVSLSTLTDGDIFGEMAFLTSRPRTATVTSITDVALFEVGKPDLARILEPRPHLLRYLYNVYISRIEATLAEIKNSSGG